MRQACGLPLIELLPGRFLVKRAVAVEEDANRLWVGKQGWEDRDGDQESLVLAKVERSQRTLRDCCGTRWMSDRCSTRSGSAPGGSTGTSKRLSTKAFRSTSDAQPSTPAPATPRPRTVLVSGRMAPSLHPSGRPEQFGRLHRDLTDWTA